MVQTQDQDPEGSQQALINPEGSRRILKGLEGHDQANTCLISLLQERFQIKLLLPGPIVGLIQISKGEEL